MNRIANQYKNVVKEIGYKVNCFCWFLSPLFDDHQFTYIYISLSLVLKWNKTGLISKKAIGLCRKDIEILHKHEEQQ